MKYNIILAIIFVVLIILLLTAPSVKAEDTYTNTSPDLIKKLVSCEERIKKDLIDLIDREQGFDTQYYECRTLLEDKRNWSKSNVIKSDTGTNIFLVTFFSIPTAMMILLLF